MYKDVLYLSADFTVYPKMIIHHSKSEPKAKRLDRVLRLTERELDGEPFVENGEWACALKERDNGKQSGDGGNQ